ncbi:MAG: hypothetical protein AB7I27_10980 [Bacteriovoracaceae bacterium]
MRFVVLMLLFLASFYYFWPKDQKVVEFDFVKLKASALKKEQVNTSVSNISSKPAQNLEKSDSIQQVEELESNADVDGLKEYLMRMEPEDGEAIYNSYLAEKENYDMESEALNKEKQNLYTRPDGRLSKKLYKANKEAINDFDNLLTLLHQKHLEKMRDILGVYFDEVMENTDDHHVERSIDLPESIEESP